MSPPEWFCEDCADGDHEGCKRSGGWPFQDTNERCGCHLTQHRLDNRSLVSNTDRAGAS